MSGRILAGVGDAEPKRALRTFFHGLDTPYGAYEAGYPIYTPAPALDRVAQAFWKNRWAVGDVARTRRPVDDPAAMAAELKELARTMGAVEVGCTSVSEAATYDHADDVLPHAIDLAARIRAMGWRAEANANLGGAPEDVALVPLAVDAGLGTLGRHGSLITRSHGSNVRLAAVLTDLPVALVDFGVEAMCVDCHVCQANCPPHAIFDTKQTVRGVDRWHVDLDRCLPYFLENEGCGVCITVCPWAQEGHAPLTALLHESRQAVASHWPEPVPERERTLALTPPQPEPHPPLAETEGW